ncbi:uncharacterized protein LOC108910714 isoform X2 [Anoplophora glabripennis]|uniref:uncharacterized protein LOC108910714 isoform X2 n=1 Tax=Anoplophora glabripennis TaxID=217634 RepID=UPI00087464EB|nr:uncharacterized protein LOC108910714 isoform X2 [Anoplophora glabripennis]
MSKRKLGKLINDNIVLIVGIPLIIGIHYGWAKLQDIPYLVDPAHKKQLPIITVSFSQFRSFLIPHGVI